MTRLSGVAPGDAKLVLGRLQTLTQYFSPLNLLMGEA
jgi:hypothetical protein